MAKREEVLQFLRSNKKFFLSKYGITRLGVFGSYAKKSYSPSSDLDLLVEMDPSKKNLHSFLEFKRFLEKELGIRVDVGLENTLKTVVKERVAKEIIYVW